MYFSEFPLRYYEYAGSRHIIPDIINRVKFKNKSKKSVSVFMEYILNNSDTPRKISTLLYESPEYDWIILLFNNIYDFYEQWPLDQHAFTEYVTNKYGRSELYSVHHYEDKEGHTVSSDHPAYDRVSISNYEYEERLNDNKRRLQILKPEYLQEVLSEFRELLNE